MIFRASVRWWMLVVAMMATSRVTLQAAELPRAADILKIHTANRQKLSRLHLQVNFLEETTEAYGRDARKQAAEMEVNYEFATSAIQRISAAELKPEDIEITAEGRRLSAGEVLVVLYQMTEDKGIIDALNQSKPWQRSQPQEFFLDGDNYQIRIPGESIQAGGQKSPWTFPAEPLTRENLLTSYGNCRIQSWEAGQSPAGRWWLPSGSSNPAIITNKHPYGTSLPPGTATPVTDWGQRHLYDTFFTQPAEKYRVLRQEMADGRELTVVDVTVRLHPEGNTLLALRAWLDLAQGAVPAKVHQRQILVKYADQHFEDWQASEITTTQRLVSLANGGFYPATTVCEYWGPDPQPVTDAAADQPSGKYAVHRRKTWDCTLVELVDQYPAGFFHLKFPQGQAVMDYSTGKRVRD